MSDESGRATPHETVEVDCVITDGGDLSMLGTGTIGDACVSVVGEPNDAGFLPEKVVVRGELEVVPYERGSDDE
ncbi:hypothetical protein [Halobaculum sp. P14]|uniref:hypothetical protein n=1 Tax=Halobaculum sp. P14 TaxID=3421638 RepID=UPI003EB83436